jgi:hypothetical protein
MVYFCGARWKMNIWYEMMGEVQLSRVLTHKMNQSVSCVSFSPLGETFASGGEDGIVEIWDSDTLKEVGHIIHFDQAKYVPAFQKGVTAVVYIDELHFVSGGRDGRVCLWSITGNRTIELKYAIESKNTPVNSLAFKPEEETLAVAYEKWGDGNLDLFDIKTVKLLQSLDVGLAPKSVVFGPDGKIISGGTGGFVVIASNERSAYAKEQVASLREGIAQSNAAYEEAVKNNDMPPPPPKKGRRPDEKSIGVLVGLPKKAQEDVLKFFGGKHTRRKQKQRTCRKSKQKRTTKRR